MTQPSPTSSDKYANEEVPSNYGYPEGYKPKGIADQLAQLRVLFPTVGRANIGILFDGPLPDGAEGWFAIPRWDCIASTYNEALDVVLATLAETRPFHNCREGQLGPNRLRRSDRTVEMRKKLIMEQNADILIVPAQFGKRHAGRSVRRARALMENTNEFGLGAFEVACMLLTHIERLTRYEDLWIDCAGDEYDYPAAVVRFVSAPFFNFSGGQLRFGTCWDGLACGRFGSASGFLPQ